MNINCILQVDIIIGKTDDFTVYQSSDQYELEEQMLSDVATVSLTKIISYFWKQRYFKLDPFQPSCFSIKTNTDFEIRINSISKYYYITYCCI